jgi:uncharacterized phage-associated protein
MKTQISSHYNELRAAESAAFFLYRAGGSLPIIKLLKLLYLAERLSFQRYGEPLTGDHLVSMPHGPVLSMTYDFINGALQSSQGGWDTWVSDRENHSVALKDQSMIRSPELDLLQLSDSDLEILSETWSEFGHWDRWKLVDYTHSAACPEWQDPNGSSSPITYASLFSALGYGNAEAAELEARMAKQQQVNAAFAHSIKQ